MSIFKYIACAGIMFIAVGVLALMASMARDSWMEYQAERHARKNEG